MNRENIDIIKAYYDAAPQMEWDRTHEGRIEYIITTRVLDRYIKKGDKILDVGGGSGRYSIWLSSLGCDVTLFDLSEGNVRFAENKAKELGVKLKTICGNAMDKNLYPDEYYDHILVMGPMYHIYNEADRRCVIENALQHLKPNGKIYIAFINLFAGMLYYLDETFQGLKDELDSGNGYGECIVENKSWQGEAFTEARFEALPEIKRFCNSFGLKQLTLFGQEGFLGGYITKIEALEEPHKSIWIDYAYKMCELEDYLSMSAHIMYVGEKTE